MVRKYAACTHPPAPVAVIPSSSATPSPVLPRPPRLFAALLASPPFVGIPVAPLSASAVILPHQPSPPALPRTQEMKEMKIPFDPRVCHNLGMAATYRELRERVKASGRWDEYVARLKIHLANGCDRGTARVMAMGEMGYEYERPASSLKPRAPKPPEIPGLDRPAAVRGVFVDMRDGSEEADDGRESADPSADGSPPGPPSTSASEFFDLRKASRCSYTETVRWAYVMSGDGVPEPTLADAPSPEAWVLYNEFCCSPDRRWEAYKQVISAKVKKEEIESEVSGEKWDGSEQYDILAAMGVAEEPA